MARIDAVRAVARMSRLLERASGELSLAHYRVLAAVADGDERASRVAARLALGKPTISASVEALCQRGLLVRESDRADGRAAALRLTHEGEVLLHAAEQRMTAALDEIVKRAPAGADTVEALTRLGAGLDVLARERSVPR